MLFLHRIYYLNWISTMERIYSDLGVRDSRDSRKGSVRVPERIVETMKLSWLQAFIEVARCESHTQAGKNLGWSQSNVSRYIGNLERWLGKPLFTGYVPPVITPHGEAFLPIAEQVVATLHGFRSPELVDKPTASVWAVKSRTEEEDNMITLLNATVDVVATLPRPEQRKRISGRDIKI